MKRNHFMAHICMDHPATDPMYDRFVEVSDRTLVIPRSAFHKFRARFGDKVDAIPQSVDFTRLICLANSKLPDPAFPADIPRPRLGYLSAPRNALNVLNRPLLVSLLKNHPGWHFVSVGPEKAVPLANAHTLPWTRPEGLAPYIHSFDVGFMPYNCYDDERLHIVPLKVFEYFAFGVPVVSTPLVHLWEYKDLIYFGDTAEELALAVEAALGEPRDSPKRAARVEIAREHSIESLAVALQQSLPLEDREIR
jgi:glycosyl transferase family 1